MDDHSYMSTHGHNTHFTAEAGCMGFVIKLVVQLHFAVVQLYCYSYAIFSPWNIPPVVIQTEKLNTSHIPADGWCNNVF